MGNNRVNNIFVAGPDGVMREYKRMEKLAAGNKFALEYQGKYFHSFHSGWLESLYAIWLEPFYSPSFAPRLFDTAMEADAFLKKELNIAPCFGGVEPGEASNIHIVMFKEIASGKSALHHLEE